MEIRERIDACLTDLTTRRRTVEALRTRVTGLIAMLRSQGEPPKALAEVLGVLEDVLAHYREISGSCERMVSGLQEIGHHLDRVEEGRRKIVTGVETILQHLTQLDQIAANGIQVNLNGGAAAEEGKPKRILLIRIRPHQEDEARTQPQGDNPAGDKELDLLLRAHPKDSTVH